MLIALLTALAAVGCAPKSAPKISTPATRLAAGATADVSVLGARPGDLVRLEARRPDVWGRQIVFRSVATFRADRCGRVSLADAPVDGPWSEADPRGPLWSMTSTTEKPNASWTGSEVRLTADVGADGSIDAAGSLWFVMDTSAFGEVALGAEHPGAFFIHPKPGTRRPVIVLIGGSEGGDGGARYNAPRFVERGYAVVGLPYYQPTYGPGQKIKGLPAAFADIPLDRLESVLSWVKARNDVGRVGVYGVSKGAEYALAAASRMSGIDAVAAIVPSDVVWEGWGAGADVPRSSFSWRGSALPFVPYEGMREALAKLSRGEPAKLRDPHDRGRAANPGLVAPARIAVESIKVPVLVAGGGKDRTWASGDMTTMIATSRRSRGLPTVALVFPEAGHSLSGTGDTPADAADARAQREIFAATIAFFADALDTPS